MELVEVTFEELYPTYESWLEEIKNNLDSPYIDVEDVMDYASLKMNYMDKKDPVDVANDINQDLDS